jgi:uroporphyrinogen decarboxylase
MKINIKPEPDFQRLRKTLLLEGKADRVPLFDFNIHESIKQQLLGRPVITAKDEIDFWINAGYDYVQVRLKPNVTESEKLSKSISSSHGNLRTLEQLNSNQFEWSSIYKNTWKLEEYNLEFLKQLAEQLPQDMKLIVHAADIFTRSWMVMGFEDFCYALYEDEELITELFRQNAIAEIRMLETSFESFGDKIGAIFYSDDLAYTEGLMVSAPVYRKYLWPYVKEITGMSKRLNLPFIYHTDGKLWELFDDFHEMGVNGIQPLEPKSMNLQELKEKRGKQFCLMGSIDIDLLSRGTTKEIDDMVRERIQILGYNGGYTVGTSNTVPDYVNVDNYKAMIEAAFKYGEY